MSLLTMLYLAGQIAIILLPVALVFFGLGFWSRGFLRKPEPAAATSTALREELRRQDLDKPELRTPVVSKVVLPEIGEEVSGGEEAAPSEITSEKPEPEAQDAPVAEHEGARGGAEEVAPDPLTKIKGIGASTAKRLNKMGINTFAQLADWTDEEIAKTDFRERILKNRWREQAADLRG